VYNFWKIFEKGNLVEVQGNSEIVVRKNNESVRIDVGRCVNEEIIYFSKLFT